MRHTAFRSTRTISAAALPVTSRPPVIVRRRTGLRRAIIVMGVTAVLAMALTTALTAQTGNRLREGIDQFEAGRYDSALTLLNEVVEQQPRCPLAYYYAARIRLDREQYTRARANLEQAVADSAGFLDAYAYLAITNRELGEKEHALTAWARFADGAGALEDAGPLSIASIMPPETYRMKLAEEKTARQARIEAEQERERERLAAIAREERERQEAAERERLANEEAARLAAQAVADSAAMAEPQTVPPESSGGPGKAAGVTPGDDTERELSIRDTPLGEIEDRISSDFRIGLIGFGVLMGVLVVGLAGMYVWFGRRRGPRNDEAAFTEQVERLLDDLSFEIDEDRVVRDFESRRRDIARELEALHPASEPEPDATTTSPREPLPEEPLALVTTALEATGTGEADEGNPPFSAITHPGVFSKQPVTEEVKTLVSRLFREGKSPEEIARVADLTTTEVNLILAVRERRLENTVAEIHQEEVHHEHDRLFEAITGLTAEGATPREIARQLNLSLSEVELATSIMNLRGWTGG